MKVLKINDMNCGHCQSRIQKALDEHNISATFDLENKLVSVDSDLNDKVLIEIVKEAGYTISEIN